MKGKFGKIDVLFLNAELASFSPIETATEEYYDNIMNLNVKGVYFPSKIFTNY